MYFFVAGPRASAYDGSTEKVKWKPCRTLLLLGNERSDDDAAARLVPFAIGLDPGPLFEVFVHHAPFLGAHRVHLDGDIAVQRLLSRPIRPRRKHLTPTLPVARGIEHNPLTIAQPTESGLKAKKLQGIDRLSPFSDQKPKIILTGNDSLNPLLVLPNLNLTIKVKLIEHTLHKLPNPLSGLLRPFGGVTHPTHPIQAS